MHSVTVFLSFTSRQPELKETKTVENEACQVLKGALNFTSRKVSLFISFMC